MEACVFNSHPTDQSHDAINSIVTRNFRVITNAACEPEHSANLLRNISEHFNNVG